ncbi:MAG: hypothetical protein DLM73_09995 [Chthoniobacterales bacterium]|nr:MAG: hypothetical protein DLM73_09995 [Chthoniobacterales bacterium]
MNKVKNLKKKIRRLKARMEKDTKRLEKLARKLGAAQATAKTTAPREPLVRTNKKRKPAPASAPTEKKKDEPKPTVKPVATEEKKSSARKAKRKLNLTPERRAQLSAAMKARWEAKRAAAAGEKHGDAAN